MLSLAHRSSRNRGFTLIELLVVIAVLGIIAAGVVTAINPLKRINQAKDTKVQNDIGQLSTALQSSFTTNQIYPDTLQKLVADGELKTLQKTPSGGAYGYELSPGCTTVSCEAAVSATLLAPADPQKPIWCWRSATGTPDAVASCSP